MQAFADGKKPKTRWNKNIDINENNWFITFVVFPA
jgi:hypothetical protein